MYRSENVQTYVRCEGREGKQDKYGSRLARQPHSAPGAFFLCVDARSIVSVVAVYAGDKSLRTKER
jgi:hypothetical protein